VYHGAVRLWEDGCPDWSDMNAIPLPAEHQATTSIRVLVVDDHEVVRATLAALLATEPDIEVVGTCADADEAIQRALAGPLDVVLMDVEMPGLLCYDAVRTIRAQHPQTSVLLLSGFDDERNIDSAIEAGAAGYITKDQAVDRVIEAIRAVAQGERWFNEVVEKRLRPASTRQGQGAGPQSEDDRIASLTERELEVLRYLARGMRKKEIAETMHLSVKTIDNHTTRLMSKLGVHDRVDLARLAIRTGLVQP